MKHSQFTSTLLLVLASTTPALAAGGGGGGGGGGGSAPSESAPLYDPAVEYRTGIAALDARNFKAAKQAFDRVISVIPRDANTQYLAGLSRVGLNDWKGARRNFEKAVKIDPKMIAAQQQLGLAHAKLSDTTKAQAVITQLESQSAACAATCAGAASLKTAIDAVKAALVATPTAALPANESLLFASSAAGDSAYLSAVGLINDGRYESAIEALRVSQASFGAHPDILTYLGFANRKLKRFDIAETYYRQALAIAPDHRGATEYFGELMVERGDLAGARVMLAKLDVSCSFGCAEAEELRRWISAGQSPHS